MKTFTFAPQRIEILVGLLATLMIAIGLLLYSYQEPYRLVSAQDYQRQVDLDEAMSLYAQNCAVCHGLAGEGIGAAPALARPELKDAESETLVKIIARGLYGTSMPAWSQSDGGPLSDYQIDELVTLIQHGDWQAAQDRVVNLGLTPQIPFTSEIDVSILEQVRALADGEALAIGLQVYASKCVACHGADGAGSNLAPVLNDPAVRARSLDEIARIIENGVSGTLMAAWKNVLNPDEMAGVIALISRWDEIPAGAVPAPDRPIPVTAETLALGAELYAQNCARCHAAEGQGTRRAPSLNVKSYLGATSDAALEQIITLGVPGTAMPSWGDRLSAAGIQAIVGFIRSWEPTAPEVATPARGGGGPWWATSGGQRPGAGALPSGGKPGGAHATPGAENNGTGAGATMSGGQGAGPQQGGGQGTGANQPGHSGQAGSTPWAQANNQAVGSSALDWRVYLLLGGGLGLSLGLITVGWVGLRQLKRLT